jgi:hypothetical protein
MNIANFDFRVAPNVNFWILPSITVGFSHLYVHMFRVKFEVYIIKYYQTLECQIFMAHAIEQCTIFKFPDKQSNPAHNWAWKYYSKQEINIPSF